MCQLMKSFKLYNERTRVHPDYFIIRELRGLSGEVIRESEEAYHTRILANRRTQNAVNRKHNSTGTIQRFQFDGNQIVTDCKFAEWQASQSLYLQAAERKEQYQ